MLHKAYMLRSAASWYLQAKSLFQVHSPYIYSVVDAIMDKQRRYYALDRIDYHRTRLLADQTPITRVDLGGGSKSLQQQNTIARITKTSVSPKSQCESLFRLVQCLKPKHILELGSSVGISTAYLAAAASDGIVTSLEGDSGLAHTARNTLKAVGIKNAVVITGAFEDTLTLYLEKSPRIDLVFLDGNHRYEPTIAYFNMIKPHLSEKACLIVDDIYWSSEMTQAWLEIKKDGNVNASVDLFYYGLILFNPQLTSVNHYSIINHKWKPWLGLSSI